MGRFIPSRFVAVRSYGASYGGSLWASPASADCRLLRQQGVDAQVKSVFRGGASLVVPEEQYERANEILSTVPNLFAGHDIAPRCPKCHAEHPFSRPPYAVVSVLAGLVLSLVVVRVGYVNAAIATGFMGIAIAAVMQAKMSPWKCRTCGCLYSDSHVHVK